MERNPAIGRGRGVTLEGSDGMGYLPSRSPVLTGERGVGGPRRAGSACEWEMAEISGSLVVRVEAFKAKVPDSATADMSRGIRERSERRATENCPVSTPHEYEVRERPERRARKEYPVANPQKRTWEECHVATPKEGAKLSRVLRESRQYEDAPVGRRNILDSLYLDKKDEEPGIQVSLVEVFPTSR